MAGAGVGAGGEEEVMTDTGLLRGGGAWGGLLSSASAAEVGLQF